MARPHSQHHAITDYRGIAARGNNTSGTDTFGTRPAHLPRHILSPEEMRARREAGLCYNCDETISPQHRWKRLFYLWAPSTDAKDDVAQDTDIVTTEISLYALVGVCPRTSDTMQLMVKVGDVELTALLDSVSTHYFIAKEAAAKAGVTLQSHRGGLCWWRTGIASRVATDAQRYSFA